MSHDDEVFDNEARIAAAFVAARHAGRALPDYPGQRPADLAAAYRIQDAAIAGYGGDVAGWKVGRINSPLDKQLGADRLAGPAFADMIVDLDAGAVPEITVFSGGFAAVEGEFMLHVAAAAHAAPPRTNDDAKALIDDVRLGIEIAASPYPGINVDGPTVTVSDFGNNRALLLGPPLDGWRDVDLNIVPVRVDIDGTTIGEATTATMLDGPYGAVRFLLNHLTARGIAWSDGLWVSSGAVTGVHDIRPGQGAVAYFGDYGTVACRIAAE